MGSRREMTALECWEPYEPIDHNYYLKLNSAELNKLHELSNVYSTEPDPDLDLTLTTL